MSLHPNDVAAQLCQASVRKPAVTVAIAAALALLLGSQALRIDSLVGYPAFLGPTDPSVERLSDFLEEFGSGNHVLVVLSCVETARCREVTEPEFLAFLGQVQQQLDGLDNVRSTMSLLNAPIIVASLETRSLASAAPDGTYVLESDWQALADQALGDRLLPHSVGSPDARTAGVVVELQSLESAGVRSLVHAIMELRPSWEEWLGAEVYAAGDPVWTVWQDDAIDSDTLRLSVLMFAIILAILYALFRSVWLAVLPVVSIGALNAAAHGIIGVLGAPMTSVLAALPPLLMVVAITASIHLLTTYLREPELEPAAALVAASHKVGAGCFWAAATTAVGFGSFLTSDLESFQSFGGIGAIGIALGFVITFTLLPALLCVFRVRRQERGSHGRPPLVGEVLQVAQQAVTRSPRFVLAIGLAVLAFLVAGLPWLRYEADYGFSERSFVVRSVRFIEANLRKPMTTEIVVSVPPGKRIYDPESLEILHSVERYFEGETTTGYVWSLLDFLEQAYRLDHDREPDSFAELAADAALQMQLVAAQERAYNFWSEGIAGSGNGDEVTVDRARISVDREWLDDPTQVRYLARLRSFLSELNADVSEGGYRVELEGGLPLNEFLVKRIQNTQRSSFGVAFLVVTLVLVFVLRQDVRLLSWAALLNVVPVLALLGLMGWIGVGVEPANTMVAAVLIAIVVDDIIHFSLAWRRARTAGDTNHGAVLAAFAAVGDAVLITSACLALGFSMLMFSSWGGLVGFGLLAALGVTLALIACLVLLPAALVWGRESESPALAEPAPAAGRARPEAP